MTDIQRRINAITGVNRGRTARARRNNAMRAMIDSRNYRRVDSNTLRRPGATRSDPSPL